MLPAIEGRKQIRWELSTGDVASPMDRNLSGRITHDPWTHASFEIVQDCESTQPGD
jgi:hypothetical protein